MCLERATGLAYNGLNCSCYLPCHYHQMQSLPLIHPEMHANIMNGEFSCQIGSKNTFDRILLDQTIEEAINKDTQTTGDTKGFITKTNAVAKYYITANDRGNYMRQLKSMVSKEGYKLMHDKRKNHTR